MECYAMWQERCLLTNKISKQVTKQCQRLTTHGFLGVAGCSILSKFFISFILSKIFYREHELVLQY
jgi:hypothetical protein